jgi:hypothetical protein
MSDKAWFNEPTILLKYDKITDVWITPKMSPEEKLNAVTRLILILVTLGYFITLSVKIIMIGVLTLGIIVLVYVFRNNYTARKESFVNKQPIYGLSENDKFRGYTDPAMYTKMKDKYMQPTVKNPMMNITVPEIEDTPNRKPAAPSYNPSVNNTINTAVKSIITDNFENENITKKLFSDIGDELNLDRSMRQWYTTPNTTIPNDQKAFREFVYGDLISGKEGNDQSLTRHNSGAYDYTNP